MRSDMMKSGIKRAPHRSLFKALGLTDEEIKRDIAGKLLTWSGLKLKTVLDY